MPRYPGAVWRPIEMQYLSGLKMVAYNRINHHVVAGYGSPWAFFNHSGRASSTFWVAKSGLVEQYMDTIYRAEADLQGNDATISIETESKGEAWTEAQLAAIIALDAWLMQTHGIPCRIADDSKIGASSQGLSWHRLGINGNFPGGRYRGRLQNGGGMLYSTATGKTCPVEPIIDQIYDRVFPALSGGNVPVPPTPVPPTPQPPQPAKRVEEDGQWGAATTTWGQRIAGTEADGIISNQYKSKSNEYIYAAQFNKTQIGSNFGRWIQTRLAALGKYSGKIDGLIGDGSIRGLQSYYGTPVDGIISPTSTVVKAMQHEINSGSFLGIQG